MKFCAPILLSLLAAVAFPAVLPAEEAPLSGDEIRQTLSGNSIVSPDFGCVYFLPDGVANLFANDQVSVGSWRVDGDLYFSSGQCGDIGCRFFGEYPSFVFRRIDSNYEQPVILIPGNHCERNGVLS